MLYISLLPYLDLWVCIFYVNSHFFVPFASIVTKIFTIKVNKCISILLTPSFMASAQISYYIIKSILAKPEGVTEADI